MRRILFFIEMHPNPAVILIKRRLLILLLSFENISKRRKLSLSKHVISFFITIISEAWVKTGKINVKMVLAAPWRLCLKTGFECNYKKREI